MNFKIDASQVRFSAAGQPQVDGDAKAARGLLQGLAVSLKSGTGVKSGYLSVARAGQGGQSLEVGLRRFRGANASTDQATTLVKELVAKAYGDQPAVRQALESYLEKSGNRIGTQSFMRLVQTLENAQEDPSGESSSLQAQPLSAVKVSRGARLSTAGLEVSAKTRQAVDQSGTEVGRALEQARGATDPVATLDALLGQYQSLAAAIERADAAGMSVDDLKASLSELNQQIAQLQPQAEQVRALASNAHTEIPRMAQLELGELRRARDDALQDLQSKADQLSALTAAFYAGQAGSGDLASVTQKHDELSAELQAAKDAALALAQNLHDKAKNCAQAWTLDYRAGVASQPHRSGAQPGTQFDGAIEKFTTTEAKTLNATQVQIAQIQDRLGPPNQVLAEHLANDRLPQAYAHLRQVRGEGAAAAMADIARHRQPPITEPGRLADFAARAFGSDASSGREVAQWMKQTFNVPADGVPARESLMHSLSKLGELNPGLARETLLALGASGQVLTSMKTLPQPGTDFYFKPMLIGSGGKDSPQLIFKLRGLDLQNSVGTIEGRQVELNGAKLAGSHLVFKPPVSSNDKGVVFNLSAASSLPAQVRVDFSDARAAYERMRNANTYGEYDLVRRLIANSGGLSQSEQREMGVLRMIERLPASRPDLKVAMMRDVVQFFHDTQATAVKEAWGPTVAALTNDPVYLADPEIGRLLKTPALSRAWQQSLLGEKLTSRPAAEAVVDYIEGLSERGRTKLMGDGSEIFNQLFSFGDELQADDPLKQRIAAMESQFLNAPPQIAMMKALEMTGTTFKGEDGRWGFEPGQERRLMVKKDLYLCTPVRNFNRLYQAPDRVNWSNFLLMRPQLGPDQKPLVDEAGDPKLTLGTEKDLSQSLPELRDAFPILQQAYETLPADGATDVVQMLLGAEEADGLRQQLTEALRMMGNAPRPAELSVSLLPYLQPVMRFDANGHAPEGISKDHYLQLMDHAAGLGFADDAVSFARYLHCLSVSFAFLSSDGALGNSSESVESLRMYALALHREAMHLSRVAPEAFKGHEQQMQKVDQMFTNREQCGHILAGGQAVMVKQLDARLAATIMPARLIGDNFAQVVDGDAEAVVAEQARNAALARDLRGQGDDGEPVVRAAMQFGQGVLVGEENALTGQQSDFSQGDFLDTELMVQFDQLGQISARLGASDPIVRYGAAAAVHRALAPLGPTLEAALGRLDVNLNQALQTLDEKARQIAAEQPAPGSSQLEIVRFRRDQKYRLDAIPEEKEAAAKKVAMQKGRVETATALLQSSADVLAAGPSQARPEPPHPGASAS